MFWIIGGFVVLLLVWYIITYNRLVRLKAMLTEAWSGIDVQLKRRHDLLPNLAETVKGYSRHESEVLSRLVEIRGASLTAGSVKDRAAAENGLTSGLRGLLAVAESYPDLKASQNFLALQGSLSEIEEQIQLSRRYYNGTVRNYDIVVQSFPSLLVAKQFGFAKADYFEIELATQRETPEVKL